MTDEKMALVELIQQATDGDLIREMPGCSDDLSELGIFLGIEPKRAVFTCSSPSTRHPNSPLSNCMKRRRGVSQAISCAPWLHPSRIEFTRL